MANRPKIKQFLEKYGISRTTYYRHMKQGYCDYPMAKGGFQRGIIPHNKQAPGESGKNKIYREYAYRAKKKGIKFDLSKEIFLELTSSNCTYCGTPPAQVAVHPSSRGHGEYRYNGIDRVDPSKGYIKENCTPCCFTCNSAKGTMTIEEFFKWVKLVYNRSSGGIEA